MELRLCSGSLSLPLCQRLLIILCASIGQSNSSVLGIAGDGASSIAVNELTALNQAIANWQNGIKTLFEAMINKELGESFPQDAMKKPVKVAGIAASDMAAQ